VGIKLHRKIIFVPFTTYSSLFQVMSPKFQKQSALKFDGRIIPEAERSGIIPELRTCQVYKLINICPIFGRIVACNERIYFAKQYNNLIVEKYF
jgi:hypothetical protein